MDRGFIGRSAAVVCGIVIVAAAFAGPVRAEPPARRADAAHEKARDRQDGLLKAAEALNLKVDAKPNDRRLRKRAAEANYRACREVLAEHSNNARLQYRLALACIRNAAKDDPGNKAYARQKREIEETCRKRGYPLAGK